MEALAFWTTLRALIPRTHHHPEAEAGGIATADGGVPFDLLPWPPCVSVLFFVHRVEGVEPGVYMLLRCAPTGDKPSASEELRRFRRGCSSACAWERVEGCPEDLPFYRLLRGDARRTAAEVSGGQGGIAADGAYTAAMLADFRRPLVSYGACMYKRVHWEAGMVAQALYLAAEAAGLQGTAMGFFFGDETQAVVGMNGASGDDGGRGGGGGFDDDPYASMWPSAIRAAIDIAEWQDVLHFGAGVPLADERLQSFAAYHHLEGHDGRRARIEMRRFV
jgi:hypothetical protein